MVFFLPCARGLEYLLADELIGLGLPDGRAARAGVRVSLPVTNPALLRRSLYRVLLWSRLASRVLWPLQSFRVTSPDDLYEAALQIDWSQHVPVDGSIAVDAHVSGSVVRHARFAAQRVKDAIVDQAREIGAARPDVNLDDPDVRLNLVVQGAEAHLAIDLGNGSLHRRGWRRQQGAAPLKENLAAAMLLRGDWPATYQSGGGLVDPMCGSGTLVIEAALMAADVAPGLQRDLGPTRWLGFDAECWASLIEEAQRRQQDGLAALRHCFVGSDIDPQAIEQAQANALAAGVAEAIDWRVAALAELESQACETGLVVCNPPYDERLAAGLDLYQQFGRVLPGRLGAWRAVLLCGDRTMARATGLRASRVYEFFNGNLPCALLRIDRLDAAVSRRSGVGDAGDAGNDTSGDDRRPNGQTPLSDGARMVVNRLRKNEQRLRGWRKQKGISCYRVYDADIPEYAAAVDLYETVQPPGRYAHVQEYQAPGSIAADLASQRLADLVVAVQESFGLRSDQVSVKVRQRGKGGAKYGRQADTDDYLEVQEGDARLLVNLFDYLDTGLFLDHRPVRRWIAQRADGQRFLNLFCYTATATVQAALGGAVSSVSVDLSGRYLTWAARNLALNGLSEKRHQFVRNDVLDFLKKDHSTYDLILCDPPTFSNSKRADDFDVQRDHVALLELAMERLSPDGVLLFSNNFRRFRLDSEALSRFARVSPERTDLLDRDFMRRPHIHRCWTLQHIV
jgi:23S rRNA (guanine2445-N2)-methyltransferase / 23S rRNA (guanine2069-N7)-methyltransferase